MAISNDVIAAVSVDSDSKEIIITNTDSKYFQEKLFHLTRKYPLIKNIIHGQIISNVA